MIIIKEAR